LESLGHDYGVIDSPQPTAEQARTALEEAGRRAAEVRRSDRQLAWMLGAVVAAYLFAGAVISVSSHQGTTYSGAAVALMLATAIVASVVIGLRIRAYTRAGIILYFSSIIAFNVWNVAVTGVSILTRFWASGQPIYHFGMSVAVGVIPPVIGMIVLARRA